ncbi:MAG: RsmE family RNA methyltransferase [Eubacteriales bacterium]|jgi:16S rRNA (uracil1498-N3)-methyltransferase|nr:RsmE family RNA methyltransferase [Eubacteriales bacterium]
MHRFFVDASQVVGKSILIDGEDVRHIRKVLRLRPGDVIEVSDSSSWEYRCRIVSVEEDAVEAVIEDKQRFAREPSLEITLYQGVPKGDRMEQVVQKCTELGVVQIVPVFMMRSVVADNGKYGKKIIRYNTIAREAAKQCRRGIVPVVTEPIYPDDFSTLADTYDLILFPYENEEKRTIKQCLRGLKEKPKRIAIIVGPEGGFSDEEAGHILFSGGISVSLGKTILRTETAGPVAAAMCMYELEMQ